MRIPSNQYIANRLSKLTYHHIGFTLVELLIVIALISILALGAATMLVDDGERALIQRAAETKSRWDAIRTAILGDQAAIPIGASALSGYVADMGRLPQSIKELMAEDAEATNPQPTWLNIAIYKKTTATNCTTSPDDCYWLGGGWRGPYLYSAGLSHYRDGWDNSAADGNPATTADDIEDGLNFGWDVQTLPSGAVPNHSDLFVQSYGSDNLAGGIEYKQDFPVDTGTFIASESDWLNTQTAIQFNIRLNKPVTADINNLYLRIFYFQDDGLSAPPPSLSNQTSLPFSILNTDRTASVLISPDADLPMSRYAAVIYCSDPETSPDPQVFDETDGTPCDSNNDSAPFYFELMPSSTSVNILWNLP